MKIFNNKKFLYLAFYIFIFSFLVFNSFNYLDNDLGWHLKIGKDIFQEKSVPHLNYYNFTLNNINWVDHEWLANLLMYLIFNKFDYIILSFIFAIITLLTIIILNRYTVKYFLKRNSHPFIILVLSAFGVYIIAPQMGVRVQALSLLFLLLLYIVINNFNSTKKTKTLIFLPLIMFFWANLHGSFLLGIGILIAWIGIKIIEIILLKYKLDQKKIFHFLNLEEQLSIKNIKTFFIFSVFSIAATFFTPYGIQLYSFLAGYRDNYYLYHIEEWLPFYYHPIIFEQLLYCGIIVTILGISVYFVYNKIETKYKITLWELFLVLFFLFFALKSRRHFPLFFISSYPLAIAFWDKFFQTQKSNLKTIKDKKITEFYLITFLLFVATFFLINTKYSNRPFQEPSYSTKTYPFAAIDFLQNNKEYDNDKIFNLYSWGGFMIWTYPERKLFIDGRLPQFSYEGHTILEEYYQFFDKEKSENKLNKHNIKLVLLNKTKPTKYNWFEKLILGKINSNKVNKNNLHTYLKNANNWELIFSDKTSYLYYKINDEKTLQ